MDDNRRPLKPEELTAIINEMSNIEYHSDDSEYILSDDDGEIDVIEGLTDNKGNSEADEDNSGPDNEDNSEIDRSSGDSDANNEDEDSDDQANTNGQTFVSKNKQVWHAAPVKLSQGRLGQQNILREKSGPTRYANREVDSIYSAFLIFFSTTTYENHCKMDKCRRKYCVRK